MIKLAQEVTIGSKELVKALVLAGLIDATFEEEGVVESIEYEENAMREHGDYNIKVSKRINIEDVK